MIVVAVLITSCQVSDQLNIGPDIIHTIISVKAMQKAMPVPAAAEPHSAILENN